MIPPRRSARRSPRQSRAQSRAQSSAMTVSPGSLLSAQALRPMFSPSKTSATLYPASEGASFAEALATFAGGGVGELRRVAADFGLQHGVVSTDCSTVSCASGRGSRSSAQVDRRHRLREGVASGPAGTRRPPDTAKMRPSRAGSIRQSPFVFQSAQGTQSASGARFGALREG